MTLHRDITWRQAACCSLFYYLCLLMCLSSALNFHIVSCLSDEWWFCCCSTMGGWWWWSCCCSLFFSLLLWSTIHCCWWLCWWLWLFSDVLYMVYFPSLQEQVLDIWHNNEIFNIILMPVWKYLLYYFVLFWQCWLTMTLLFAYIYYVKVFAVFGGVLQCAYAILKAWHYYYTTSPIKTIWPNNHM